MTRRLIIGISGASGFQYGIKALSLLRAHDVETHLVVSKSAEMTRALETPYEKDEPLESWWLTSGSNQTSALCHGGMARR